MYLKLSWKLHGLKKRKSSMPKQENLLVLGDADLSIDNIWKINNSPQLVQNVSADYHLFCFKKYM